MNQVQEYGKFIREIISRPRNSILTNVLFRPNTAPNNVAVTTNNSGRTPANDPHVQRISPPGSMSRLAKPAKATANKLLKSSPDNNQGSRSNQPPNGIPKNIFFRPVTGPNNITLKPLPGNSQGSGINQPPDSVPKIRLFTPGTSPNNAVVTSDNSSRTPPNNPHAQPASPLRSVSR